VGVSLECGAPPWKQGADPPVRHKKYKNKTVNVCRLYCEVLKANVKLTQGMVTQGAAGPDGMRGV